MQILFSVIAIILIWVYVIVRHDTHHFVVRRYDVESDKIKEELTITLVSDLHEKDYGAHNEKLTEAVLETHPDLILSAGDLITCHGDAAHCDDKEALHFVAGLSSKHPVVLGMGNHESKLAEQTATYGDYYARYEKELLATGAVVLRNAWEKDIAEQVDIAGFEIDTSYYKRFNKETIGKDDLEKALGTTDPSRFTILIAHDPRHFRAYAEWGADLTVSGHVHGGIVRLPGLGGVIAPSMQLFPHYDAGEYTMEGEGKKATMIVSCGLGSHTLHIRFNNPGEIAVIRLHPAHTGK